MTSVSDADAPTVNVTTKVRESPDASAPIVQTPVVVLNVLPPLPMAETNVTPAGRFAAITPASLIVTPVAEPGPEFVAVTV